MNSSANNQETLRIVRLQQLSDDALLLLAEYFEALHVIVRDSHEELQNIIENPASGFWLAYLGSEAVGCIVLRSLPSIPAAGECKRLYVRPSARGRGIAGGLFDALEQHARSHGIQWIYLDSHHDLAAALNVYKRRGYLQCDRYNDNPQATLFLRKRLA